MVKKALILIGLLFFGFYQPGKAQAAIIADHNAVREFDQIPEYWLDYVKQNITLHYAHTSHGSQINSGLEVLEDDIDPVLYSASVRISSTEGLPPVETPSALRIYDGTIGTTYVTTSDYWASGAGLDKTRQVAGTGHYNFSLWSWCGELSKDWTDVSGYLSALNQLEQEYPSMRFIYMTGHTDGTGSGGILHQNNNTVRQYVLTNNKVLYDFEDIGRYDPSGHDYLDEGGGAFTSQYGYNECIYNGGNWCLEWCAANPNSGLCLPTTSCAHSDSLNCNMKARAFWWLMARLAGWPGVTPEPTPTPQPTATPTSGVCPGDVNGSGVVDLADLRLVLADYGSILSDYDIDGNIKVNNLDLGMVIGNWGVCP